MDEITLDGKPYISTKRGAEITGYAKDYIGQLCREGRIEARLVGRSWYVFEPSLREHRFGSESIEAQEEVAAEEPTPTETSEKTINEAVWEPAVYTSEDITKIEDLSESEPEEKTEEPVEPVEEVSVDQKLQDAPQLEAEWQQWFVNKAPDREKVTEEAIAEEEVHITIAPEAHKEPVQTHYPDRRVVDMVAVRPPVQENVEPYTPVVRQRRRERSPILPAILIGIMLISMSFAIAVSGITERFADNSQLGAVIRFLGGTSLINE